MLKTTWAVLSAMFVAACSAPGIPQPPLSGHWDLVELGGTKVGEDRRPNIVFSEAEVSGFAGCNQFQGSFEQERETLEFGPVASTRMYCEESADLETRYLAMLERTTRFTVAGNRLSLFSGDELLALFKPTGHELAPYR